MNDPESRDPAVDLVFVPEPGLSPEDRDLDAQLARLVSTHLHSVALPPSRIDLAGAKSAAAARKARSRRRSARWVAAGLAAAAASVAAVVGVSSGVFPAPLIGPSSADGSGTSWVQLRAGVPELPAAEVEHLSALRGEGPLHPGDWAVGPIASWTTPVDCDAWMDNGVRLAVLDGIDASRLQQTCVATTARDADGTGPEAVYRFYLPQGVDLSGLTLPDATGAGVSWTVALVGGPDSIIDPEDRLAELGGDSTTVRWGDDTAWVYRAGDERTEIAWVDPFAHVASDDGSAVVMNAVVAAEPVTAVRAALGFQNQGGMQVLDGDDGSLLLVEASPPRFSFTALAHGALARSPEGCLGLAGGGRGFQMVVWPYGTTWDASTQTLSLPGEGGVRLGQQLSLGGGYGPGTIAERLVPAGCVQESVFS